MINIVDIAKHYENIWKTNGQKRLFSKGPINELPQGFHVLEFPPHGEREMWTYATCGMSQCEGKKPLELHIFSDKQAVNLVELLTTVAHYHCTGAQLDLGHTVNFGIPWCKGSQCTYGLISLPYLDGETLEILTLNGESTQFLWLIPITEKERNFKKQFGLEKLEEQFEKNGFEYSNQNRQSVI